MTTTLNDAEKIINDPSLAEEDLLNDLENEDFAIPAHIRARRMEEFRNDAARFTALKADGHGGYDDLTEEKQFLDMTTKEPLAVIHFYHSSFETCKIMDKHLQIISEKHFRTKFAKINVDVAKFFVAKLKIQVLPYVICFDNGQIVDRISGFSDFGNSVDFKTEKLEKRLAQSGMIELANNACNTIGRSTITGGIKSSSRQNDDDTDSDD